MSQDHPKKKIIKKKKKVRDAWVAQLFEWQTLGFHSGGDFRVR